MNDDLISRQAAIEAAGLNTWAGSRISKLPSAQPERTAGKWIEDDDSIVHGHCLRCGWPARWQITDVFGMNFCPNCGAYMVEGKKMKNLSEDMVQVVRCKDCKHYIYSNEKCNLIDTRLNFYTTDKIWTNDCFCAWGERRDDEESPERTD